MIKYKKDLTNCLSQAKFPISQYETRYYSGFLWKDRKSLAANIILDADEKDDDMDGICCHSSYFVGRNTASPYQIKCPRKLGEIHFIADKWDLEVVSHECLHATINIARMLNCHPFYDINYEEQVCYIHGELVDMVYRWLWQANPKRSIWKMAWIKLRKLYAK